MATIILPRKAPRASSLSINRWTKQEVRRAKLERENAKIEWEKKKQGFELRSKGRLNQKAIEIVKEKEKKKLKIKKKNREKGEF